MRTVCRVLYGVDTTGQLQWTMHRRLEWGKVTGVHLLLCMVHQPAIPVIIPVFASLRSGFGPLWWGEPVSEDTMCIAGSCPTLLVNEGRCHPSYLAIWSNLFWLVDPFFKAACLSHLVQRGGWQGICFCQAGIWRGNSPSLLTAKVWDFWNPYFKMPQIPLHFQRNTTVYSNKYK